MICHCLYGCGNLLITGRNKVLAKVIFSEACVILSTGEDLVPGVSNFSGAGVLVPGRVPPNYLGGGVVSGPGVVPPNVRGGGHLHQNTVNIWPVRILISCFGGILDEHLFKWQHVAVCSLLSL